MTRRELILALTAPLARAQFTSSVRVVNVFVTVRDKQGELVHGLTREDFELREDGRKQSIRYFSADSDLQLTLGLLFDVSGSQRSVLEQQKAAAQAFLERVLRPGDNAFFVAFDRDITLFGRNEIDQLTAERPGNRGTALFNTIVRASQHIQAEPGRKALIVLSDGIDTASAVKLSDAVTAAHRADTSVFPIRFYDRQVFAFDVPSAATENLRAGKRALERIAKETGGGFYEISSARSLDENFSHIQDELRSQYSLGYSPAAGRAGYRKLRVQVKQRGLTTQARDGYFWTE